MRRRGHRRAADSEAAATSRRRRTPLRDLDGTLTATIANRPSGTGTMVYMLGAAQRPRRLSRARPRARATERSTPRCWRASARPTGCSAVRSRFARVRWSATTRIAMRLRLSGAAPTALSLRVWNAAQTEPASWDLVAQRHRLAAATIRDGRGDGVRVDDVDRLPLTVRFDNVQVTSGPPPRRSPTAVPRSDGPSTRSPPARTSCRRPGTTRIRARRTAPFRTLGKAVAAAPSGSTIVMRGGVYRESVTWYGKALTIQPAPDEAVWMRGSDVVTGWVADGAVWRTGQLVGVLRPHVALRPDRPRVPVCGLPDQIFVDGAQLTQVGSRSAVTAGQVLLRRRRTPPLSRHQPQRPHRRGQHPVRGRCTSTTATARSCAASASSSTRRARRTSAPSTAKPTICSFVDDEFRNNAAAGLSIDGDRISVVSSRCSTRTASSGCTATRSRTRGSSPNRFVGNDAQHFAVTGASGGMKLTTVSNVHGPDEPLRAQHHPRAVGRHPLEQRDARSQRRARQRRPRHPVRDLQRRQDRRQHGGAQRRRRASPSSSRRTCRSTTTRSTTTCAASK